MPFVNIQILKGHPQERKDEIAHRVTATTQRARPVADGGHLGRLRRGGGDDWYVGPTRVSEMKKRVAGNERRYRRMPGVELRDA